MKKTHLVILALALTALLTACNGAENNSGSSDGAKSDTGSQSISEPTSNNSKEISDSSDASYSSIVSESNSVSVDGNEITAQFEVPDGGRIDLTNAIVQGMDGTTIPIAEMTADNWDTVTINGVYLAEAAGIYYDSVINADIFDKDAYTFSGTPDTAAYDYKKYNIGDTFGELKVTEATTTFSPFVMGVGAGPKYFSGGKVRFEGTPHT